MTEKEKQQKGMLYQANDPEVLKDLYYCENKCYGRAILSLLILQSRWRYKCENIFGVLLRVMKFCKLISDN